MPTTTADEATANFIYEAYLLLKDAPPTFGKWARQGAMENIAARGVSWRVVGISEAALRKIAETGKSTGLQRGHWFARDHRYESLFGMGTPPMERAALIQRLSVNYVDRQLHLAESDDRGGNVVERDEAALELIVSHEQFAEAVEPAIADLDHPAPCLLGWIVPLGISRFAHVGTVIIIGGDSDFMPVARKIKAAGRTLIGIGTRKNTNKDWAKSCHEFSYYAWSRPSAPTKHPSPARPRTRQHHHAPAWRPNCSSVRFACSPKPKAKLGSTRDLYGT